MKAAVFLILFSLAQNGFASESTVKSHTRKTHTPKRQALIKLTPEQIPQLDIDEIAQAVTNPTELGFTFDFMKTNSPKEEDGAGSKASLKLALTSQIERCKSLNVNEVRNFGPRKVSRSEWCIKPAQWFLDRIDAVSSLQELYVLAIRELDWYQSTGKTGKNDVFFTGYYYPEVKVKKRADAIYRYPIYKMPKNARLAQLSRAQIASGALKGKGLELGYAENPFDPFMLQVQGSGALQFVDTNERVYLRYAGQNGRHYVSLGAVMRSRGIPEYYTNCMQCIRKYFEENPQAWVSLSNQNPSFVFFDQSDGAYGSAGARLTEKHSIAVDDRHFPLGSMGLIQAARPSKIVGEEATEWRWFSQFVIAQDTGGAIKSPGRVDIFWGSGDYAEVAAGQSNLIPGSLYFMLLPEAHGARN